MTRMRRMITVVLAVSVMAIGMGASAASAADRTGAASVADRKGVGASAEVPEDRNGDCEPLEACFWYHPNYQGSMVDILVGNSPDPDGTFPPAGFNEYDDISHYNDKFLTAGSGQHQLLINNAASALNKDSFFYLSIYANKRCTGAHIQIPPNHSHPDLNNIRNNNESHCWR
jgi:hypothetical protein